jgi:Axin beta-catenin binding motif
MSAVSTAILVASAGDVEESAQSILERHVSRVFDSPDAQQTPTRSMDSQSLVGLPTSRSTVTCADHQTSCDSVKYMSGKLTGSARYDESAKLLSTHSCVSSKADGHDVTLQSRALSMTCAEQSEFKRLSESLTGSNHGHGDSSDVAIRHPAGGIITRHQQLQQQPVCNHTCANDK